MNRDQDRVFAYLDSLRESGKSDICQINKYLEIYFGFTPLEARDHLMNWLEICSERQPEKVS